MSVKMNRIELAKQESLYRDDIRGYFRGFLPPANGKLTYEWVDKETGEIFERLQTWDIVFQTEDGREARGNWKAQWVDDTHEATTASVKGLSTDVYNLFQACFDGDEEAAQTLLHYYRTTDKNGYTVYRVEIVR